MDLAGVRSELTDHRSRDSRLTIPSRDLRMDEDGLPVSQAGTYAPVEGALDTLARFAHVPGRFFRWCPGDVRAALFNRFCADAKRWTRVPKELVLVVRDGRSAVGLADAGLVHLASEDVLQAALEARPATIEEDRLEVVHFHVNGHLQLDIVSPAVQAEPRPGDTVRAGISISHSEVGKTATRLESFFLRLARKNGLLLRVCQHDSISQSRIRRAAAGNAALTRQRVHDMAARAWGELDAKMSALERLTKTPADNAAEVIRAIGERLRLSDRLIEDLIAGLTEDEGGRQDTLFDVAGAFSRLGTHSDRLSPATRRYLQEVGGEMVGERLQRCPTCGALRRGRMRLLPRR